jgi:hypothetical protein
MKFQNLAFYADVLWAAHCPEASPESKMIMNYPALVAIKAGESSP